MDYLEKLEQEIYDNNITLNERHFDAVDGVSTKYEGNYYIGVNKALNGSKKHDVLLHELGHIMTSSFYDFGSSSMSVKRKEYKANLFVAKKVVEPSALKDMLVKQRPLYEIADFYNLTEETIREIIRIYRCKKMI